jgi:hypothetical protein
MLTIFRLGRRGKAEMCRTERQHLGRKVSM